MKVIKSYFILLSVFILLNPIFGANNESDFLNTIIKNKNSKNSKVSQAEFVVLLGRMLEHTNDLAPSKIIKQLNGVPKWAEKEAQFAQNKFGQLTPYYFEKFSPRETIKKETIVKFLTAYLEVNNKRIKQNNKINFNPSFFKYESSYQTLIDYEVLPNNYDSTLSKYEIAKALIRVSEIRQKRIAKLENKQNKNNDNNSKVVSLGKNEVEISANGGMGNLYIWRGMNQGNGGMSNIFGGIDTVFNEKFSFGTWASNVSFSENTSYEWDLYTSFTDSSFIPGIDYEIGYIYYAYPDSEDPDSSNFSEGYVGLTNDTFSIRYYLLMSGPDNAKVGNDGYFNISLTTPLIQGFNLVSSIGHYSGKTIVTEDQVDYLVGLNKKNFTFATTGTNNSEYTPKILIQYELALF